MVWLQYASQCRPVTTHSRAEIRGQGCVVQTKKNYRKSKDSKAGEEGALHTRPRVILNKIQFSLFYEAQYHKLRICLSRLNNLYTDDIPDLWPRIRSEKKPFAGKKKSRTLQESNRGGSLSRMDRNNICHVTRRNHYRVITHSMSLTESYEYFIVGMLHDPDLHNPISEHLHWHRFSIPLNK